MKLQRNKYSFEIMLSLFAALVLVAVATVGLLLPELRTYTRYETKRAHEAYTEGRLQQEYDRLFEMKSEQEAVDAVLQDRLDNPVKAGELEEWFGHYLGPTVLHPERSDDGRIIGAEISAVVRSPSQVYEMLDALANAPWVLQLRLPVEMRKEKKGIRTTLRFRVLTLSEKSAREQ